MRGSVSATERILARMAASSPIASSAVDLTLEKPGELRRALGRTIAYFARVEGEVSSEPLAIMLPRLGTRYRGYRSLGAEFLPIWVSQERAHGLIFDELQRRLGLEPVKPNTRVPPHNRILGALGRLSPALHAVLEMVYLARGAMHEKLTAIGYDRMIEAAGRLGERALRETLLRPIRAQEAIHLAYYATEARRLREHLEPWQLALARRISILTYAPVGAGAARDRADFGHAALVLAGERIEPLTEPVAGLAERLLGRTSGPPLPDFVARAVRRCVEAERAA